MLTEIGRRALMFSIATTIVSSLMIPVIVAAGLTVPDILVKYSSIVALATGHASISTLISFTSDVAIGIGSIYLFNLLAKLMGVGGVEVQQAIGLKAIATYLAIWIPAANGTTTIVYSIAQAVATLYPATAATTIMALATGIDGFIKFSELYYLASRVLGLPAE